MSNAAERGPDAQPGLWGRLKAGLRKTRGRLAEGLGDLLLGKREVDAAVLEELEAALLMTDVGMDATERIMQALATGEQIEKATFKFFRTSTSGTQEHYYTIELEEGLITDVTTWFPNALQPENAPLGHMEDVSLSYKKITATHEVAGTSGADDWNA